MRFGSLFSGIGGIDLGLERSGMECAWQIENEPYCLKVLAKHWPNVKRYEDIREVDFGGVEPVELLAGGFPCQDISDAGKRIGIKGERSGLWSEFKRAIRVVRPKYVLVENVQPLLRRGMDVVLGDLSLLGYDAEWESLPAAAFGAPHLRWRIFIVAYPRHDEPSQWIHSPNRIHRESNSESESQRSMQLASRGLPRRTGVVANTNESRLERVGNQQGCDRASVFERAGSRPMAARSVHRGWWATEPQVGRMAYGLPRRVDRLRGLGNAVVPQKAEYLGRLILEHARTT